MKNREIFLILDNSRSRENVGSIFRTADAVGVSKIYLTGITPQPPHPKILKASLGAENYVPWEYRRTTKKLITELKNKSIKIYALEQAKNSKDIFKLNKSAFKDGGWALVLGNEVKGVNRKILEFCDMIIEIPMQGKKESLNVSVSAGIALFQMIHGKR